MTERRRDVRWQLRRESMLPNQKTVFVSIVIHVAVIHNPSECIVHSLMDFMILNITTLMLNIIQQSHEPYHNIRSRDVHDMQFPPANLERF